MPESLCGCRLALSCTVVVLLDSSVSTTLMPVDCTYTAVFDRKMLISEE